MANTTEPTELDDLGREIQAALSEDKDAGGKLRHTASRDGAYEFDGYCAVASEAYFYLSGAALAGLDLAEDDTDWEEAGRRAHAAGIQPMQLTQTGRRGSRRSVARGGRVIGG